MTNARKRLIRARKQYAAIGRVLAQLHTRSAPVRKRRKEPTR